MREAAPPRPDRVLGRAGRRTPAAHAHRPGSEEGVAHPQADGGRRTARLLDTATQELLSLWAVKTCLFLELAIRQMYAGKRLVEGYLATTQELAWLRQKSEPPPRSMVWLGYWDCQKSVPVVTDLAI